MAAYSKGAPPVALAALGARGSRSAEGPEHERDSAAIALSLAQETQDPG